jgi:hypothetical protein
VGVRRRTDGSYLGDEKISNHFSHAALPYPVKGARYSVFVPYLDADGDPLDPTTPDTEISKDAATFADCAEEVTTIAGGNGSGYLTLTGAELDCSLAILAAKVASGPKATLLELRPRVLPVLESGTAQAGAAGTITLAAGAAAYNLAGCILRTTGGTGGGGTGGANNQARVITAYSPSTKIATVVPNWETNPAAGTTYEVLITEMAGDALGTADAILTRDWTAVVGEAARSVLNALRTLRNKTDLVTTPGTGRVKKEDDATDAWTFTYTTSPTAQPITSTDPA